MAKDNKVIKLKGTEYDLEDTKFWLDVQKFTTHGILATDKNGHSAEVRVRLLPAHKDLIDGRKEKMPKGMYKSYAAFYRACLLVGERTIAEFMSREHGMNCSEWVKWLRLSCGLSAKHNIDHARIEAQKKVSEIACDSEHPLKQFLPLYSAAVDFLKSYKSCGLEVGDLKEEDDYYDE